MARRKQKASLGSMIVLAIIVAIVWAVENVDFRKDKEPAENPTTEVHFVDVGQGDGALVISGDEDHCFIGDIKSIVSKKPFMQINII